MAALKWYLMQLFPFKYDTTYKEEGKRYVTIWRMFLGRCYDVKTYQIMN